MACGAGAGPRAGPALLHVPRRPLPGQRAAALLRLPAGVHRPQRGHRLPARRPGPGPGGLGRPLRPGPARPAGGARRRAPPRRLLGLATGPPSWWPPDAPPVSLEGAGAASLEAWRGRPRGETHPGSDPGSGRTSWHGPVGRGIWNVRLGSGRPRYAAHNVK